MRKINKQKGILFWITGLSGSGKSTMGKKIHKRINNLYGPTIMISGDNVRKIFGLKGHTKTQRLNITKKYCNFAKYIVLIIKSVDCSIISKCIISLSHSLVDSWIFIVI